MTASKIEVPEWGECVRGGVNLYVPFNEEFVEALKKSVSQTRREWHPGEVPFWWVHDSRIDAVEELLHEHFEDYEP